MPIIESQDDWCNTVKEYKTQLRETSRRAEEELRKFMEKQN